MTEDRILLEGMILYGYHGTVAAERELGQRFVVDVELRVDLRPAGMTDDLTKSVDYSEVYRQVRQIVEGPPVGLTETVAEHVAGAILDRHARVEAVRVRVAKPHVRLDGGVLTASAVEILRGRSAEST